GNAEEEVQGDLPLGVVLLDGKAGTPDADGQVQLLADLTDEGLLEGLLSLAATAGKLPETSQMSVLETSRDEDVGAPQNDSCGYIDPDGRLGAVGSGLPGCGLR